MNWWSVRCVSDAPPILIGYINFSSEMFTKNLQIQLTLSLQINENYLRLIEEPRYYTRALQAS